MLFPSVIFEEMPIQKTSYGLTSGFTRFFNPLQSGLMPFFELFELFIIINQGHTLEHIRWVNKRVNTLFNILRRHSDSYMLKFPYKPVDFCRKEFILFS